MKLRIILTPDFGVAIRGICTQNKPRSGNFTDLGLSYTSPAAAAMPADGNKTEKKFWGRTLWKWMEAPIPCPFHLCIME